MGWPKEGPLASPSPGWAAPHWLQFHFSVTGFTFGQERKKRETELQRERGRVALSGTGAASVPIWQGHHLLLHRLTLPWSGDSQSQGQGVKVKFSLLDLRQGKQLLDRGSFPHIPCKSGAENPPHGVLGPGTGIVKESPEGPQWEGEGKVQSRTGCHVGWLYSARDPWPTNYQEGGSMWSESRLQTGVGGDSVP